MSLRPLKFLQVYFLALLSLGVAGSASAQIQGGSVVVGNVPPSTPVMLRSGNVQTLALLNTAFEIHGGFTVVDSPLAADFILAVDPLGPRGAMLVISSGVPEQTIFSETLAGDSSVDAVYRSIDRAIYKVRRGESGFFSGKLAFVSEETGSTEVYVSDLLFQSVTRLTSDGTSAVRPRWSPDGNSIVYTSYKTGFPDIYRLDLLSQRREVVADYNGLNMDARYSPDGSRLAMILSGNSNADIWIREANGQMNNLTKSRGLEAAPAWSPDGTRLVYTSDERGGPQLYVIPSRGGTARRLRTDISGDCAQPDWNPVFENQIAFSAAMGAGRQIIVFDSVAGASRIVSNESGDAIEPHWLSDGRHLIYTHRRANRSEIKIMDTLSQKNYRISGSRVKVSQPSFVTE